MPLRLLTLLLLLGSVPVHSDSLQRQLKTFQRWFKEAGGRWGHGVEPEVAGGVCYKPTSSWHDEVQALASYRVVTRARVPRETVRLSRAERAHPHCGPQPPRASTL